MSAIELSTLPMRAWLCLEAHSSLDLQLIKLFEETGEVAGAWVGLRGSNPRKGVTHEALQVAQELADVAWTAMITIEALGFNAEQIMAEGAKKIESRIEEQQP